MSVPASLALVLSLGVLAAGGTSTASPEGPGARPRVAVPGPGVAVPDGAEAAEGTRMVPLRVREHVGVDRRRDPVTSGVPLPLAAGVRDVGDLWIGAGDCGSPVPAQLTALARWNAPPADGSAPIKWLLVDFQADVDAGGSAVYYLCRSEDPSSARSRLADRRSQGVPSLSVQAGPAGVEVDTGPLSFRVGRGGFNLIENVRVDDVAEEGGARQLVPESHRGGVWITRPDGSLYASSDDDADVVVVEEAGPLRAVVRVEGRHHSRTDNGAVLAEGRPAFEWLDYTARIHAYAGKPWVRIFYSVRYTDRFQENKHNMGGGPVEHVFEALSVALPTTLDGRLRWTLGGEADTPSAYPDKRQDPAAGEALLGGSLQGGQAVELYQDSSGVEKWGDSPDGFWGTRFRGYRAMRAGEPVGSGLQASGWAHLSDGAHGVTVGMRHFWQNFPKGLRLSSDGLVAVELWPAGSRDPHRLRGGRQKTHELFVGFHAEGDVDPGVTFESFASPLRAVAPPEWYRDSLALGTVSAEGEGDAFRRYERWAEAVIGALPGGGIWEERFDKDLYGWRNWGDSYRGGWKNLRYFGNNEFDFGWAMLLQHVRKTKPDPRYWAVGESMIRHLYDIDLYHTGEDSVAYSHGIRKHDSSGVEDHSKTPMLSHFWIQGLLLYWALSGDAFAMDAASEVTLWLDGLVDDDTGELLWSGESRAQAWAVLALLDLWEYTGQRRHLDTAARVLEAEVVAEQDLSGARYPCPHLDWQGDAGEVDKENAAVWQNGYVAEALGRYALARRRIGRPDGRAERALFRNLDAIAECGWATLDNGMIVADDEDLDNVVYGRPYGALVVDRLYPDGTYKLGPPINHTLSNGYAYGALLAPSLTRRQRYLDMARETWRWTMGPYSSPGEPHGEPDYCCPATPAKNAAFRLRFGQTYLWLEQMLAADRVAPKVSSVRVEGVGTTTATIRWQVSSDATGWVEYGRTAALGETSSAAAQLVEQSASLGGLEPGTRYFFRVRAEDLSHNVGESEVRSFTTRAVGDGKEPGR